MTDRRVRARCPHAAMMARDLLISRPEIILMLVLLGCIEIDNVGGVAPGDAGHLRSWLRGRGWVCAHGYVVLWCEEHV